MALPTLPIWTFRPNWKQGITERLEWLTDVLDSNNGTEQRRALRLSPRRSFEMLFNPTGNVRSYFGLFLHRLATEEFMLPVFHDKARLTNANGVGSVSLGFDNTYREFVTGGYAILLSDPFTYEVVEITDQSEIGLVVEPTLQAWPAGTAVYPLVQARLSDESAVAALTSRVGQSTLRFQLNQSNEFDEGLWTDTYEGLPLLSKAPNRRESLDLSFIRRADLQDAELGLSYLADEADRAFTVQMHSWMIRGRQEHAEFRAMLYRLRGRHQAAWLPTFNEDITLARASAAANSYLHVQKIGYAYTGGTVSGRTRILIRNAGANIVRTISGTGAPLAAAEERLNLSAPIGAILPAGRSGSFLDVCRLDQDGIDIFHATDTDGVSECKAAFRSFLNERIEDEIVAAPLPSGLMNDFVCGEWDDRAIAFVIDRSGSMAGTRLASMKSAMTQVLNLIGAYVNTNVMDIAIVPFSSGGATIRRSATLTGIQDLINAVNALTASGGTNFAVGMNGAKTFFDNTDPSLASRYIFFITDGEPEAGTNTAAAVTLNSMVPVPLCYGINIELVNTASTAVIDNTPADGVPVVSGADASGLIDAVLGAF